MTPDQFQAEEVFCTLMARKLAGVLHAEDAAALERVFDQFPAWRLKADMLERMFDQEKAVFPSPDAQEAYVRHWLRYRDEFAEETVMPEAASQHAASWQPAERRELPFQSDRRPLRAWGQWTVLAGIAGLLLVLGFLLNNRGIQATAGDRPSTQLKVISTAYGRKGQVSLPDGSQVRLNAGSTLRYDSMSFLTSGRYVELSGEAYFDIAHDPKHPFIVQSGPVRVRVLGTVFNVRAYPEDPDVETSLIRGSVEVTLDDRPDDKYILRPHEKLVVSNKKAGLVQQVSDSDGQVEVKSPLVSVRKITVADSGKLIHETAWVDNKLVFRSEDFSSLSPRMERHFGVKLTFENPARRALNFTGIFTTETISQALEAMRLVHPFEYSLDDENVYIK